MKPCISSISVDATTGEAKIIIEGCIPTPKECDDPIVELFRPIREKYKESMSFVILTKRTENKTVCTIYPSNCRGRDVKTFLLIANRLLRDNLIGEYQKLLETFFNSKDGLQLYLKKLEQAEKSDDKSEIYESIDSDIKKFVEKEGMKMPTLKPQPKPKKTRAEKRKSSEEYLKKHPEILNNKKPAN